ncbi:MAG: 30S ribosomal protein S2 [Chloroflexi bacterium]|nr:30S ribosomal protein S2 [Chloroflexota bacterium]
MALVTLKELLEAGVHFGHRTRRWNPKMRPYIFTERNGVHIIDLQQTLRQLEKAYSFVRDLVADGGIILFVGTKRQAADIIVSEATRCGMPYVNKRWLGGTLTNFRTIRSRVDYMIELEERRDRGEFNRLPKLEALKLNETIDRLNLRVGGLRTLDRLPDALFIVDVRREDLAVREAVKLNIPIVAVVDTNCDPDPIEIVIPSNDDAIRSIRLMTGKIADAVVEGKNLRETMEAEAEAEAEAEREAAEVIARRVVTSAARFEGEHAEDELLGPSTLAKLEMGIGSDELEEVQEVEEPVAETEEPAAEAVEESAAESVEEKPEEPVEEPAA